MLALGESTCQVEVVVEGRLRFGRVGVPAAQPFGEGMEGRIGEELGKARHDEFRAGRLGAAEMDGVVVQGDLEVMPEAGNDAIGESGELVAGRLWAQARVSAALEVGGEVAVGARSIARIRQPVANGEGAALLEDRLIDVALVVE